MDFTQSEEQSTISQVSRLRRDGETASLCGLPGGGVETADLREVG